MLQHSHIANPHDEKEVLDEIEDVYYNDGHTDTSQYELDVSNTPFRYSRLFHSLIDVTHLLDIMDCSIHYLM